MGGGGGGSAPALKPDDTRPAIRVFVGELGVWPANSDLQWIGKGTNVDTGNPEYKSKLWRTSNMGNTPAPQGHYIINPFYVDRGAVSGLNISAIKDSGTPTCVAFYAGRVWYSGVNSTVTGDDSNSSRVFFSQVLESIAQAGYCYQAADPTSKEVSDLIASDGGVVRILGAGQIYGIVSILDSLIVIAEYGAWQISNETGAFEATSYGVQKITTDGCVGKQSIVNMGNAVVYWGTTGIIFISPNDKGIFSAQNISQTTIQNYYLSSIPSEAKREAVGVFDAGENVVSWLYYENINYAGTGLKTHELNFRIGASGFYKYRFAGPDNYITGFDEAEGTGYDSKGTLTTSETIPTADYAYPMAYAKVPYIIYSASSQTTLQTTIGDDIVDSTNDPVIVDRLDATSSRVSAKKYIVSSNNSNLTNALFFGELKNTRYVDEVSYKGAGVVPDYYAYSAHLQSGSATMSDPSRDKEITYLTSFIYKHSPLIVGTDVAPIMLDGGGAIMNVRWDFSSAATQFDTYKSSMFEGYKWDEPFFVEEASLNDPLFELYPGREMVISKNRVNGNGKSASIRIDVPPMKGCHILGYSLEIKGNANV